MFTVHLARFGETGLRVPSLEPVLVHDPVGLLTLGRPPSVEHERLLHPDKRLQPVDLLVLACGLPVARTGCPICPQAGRVLPVPDAEEVPLLLSHLSSPFLS